jgi:hypothetical protein
LDEGKEDELIRKVKVYGQDIIHKCLGDLKRLVNDPCMEKLPPYLKNEFTEKIEHRIQRASETLSGRPLLSFNLGSRVVTEGGELAVQITVKNPRVVPLKAKISISGDFEVDAPTHSLVVPELQETCLDIRLKPRSAGPKKITAKLEIQGESSSPIIVEEQVSVNPYKPELVVEASPLVDKARVGEEVEVKLTLRNIGTVPLKINIPGSQAPLTLESGEQYEANLKATVPDSGVIKLEPITFTDPKGNLYRKEITPIKLIVEKAQEPQKRETPEPQKEEKLPIKEAAPQLNLEDILSQIASHALAAFIGKIIGEKFPEKKEFPKPVLVEDLPYILQGDTTVILEDPSAVIEDDKGSYLIVRKAKPAELQYVITVEAAVKLVDNFKLAVDSALRSWNPFPDADLSKKTETIQDEELKSILKKTAQPRREIPENFRIEYTFSRGGLLKKTILRVHVGCYSRLKVLYERGRDDVPASIGGVMKSLELPEPAEDTPSIYVLASPTGWDPSSVRQAEGSSRPALYILINLKTGELHYNSSDPLSTGLAEELKKILGITGPLLHSEEILDYDKMLLKGEITEEFYRKKIHELLLKQVKTQTTERHASQPPQP